MKKEQTYIYLALFNENIYDSGDTTISVHKTKKGAMNAVKKHKEKLQIELNKKNQNVVNSILPELSETFSCSPWVQKKYKNLINFAKAKAPTTEWKEFKSSRSWGVEKIELLD